MVSRAEGLGFIGGYQGRRDLLRGVQTAYRRRLCRERARLVAKLMCVRGVKSVRPRSRSVAPSCPFHEAHESGVRPTCVGIDVVPFQQHPHGALLATTGNQRVGCSAIFVGCVGIDAVPLQQDPHGPHMAIGSGPRERCSTIFVSYIRVKVKRSN